MTHLVGRAPSLSLSVCLSLSLSLPLCKPACLSRHKQIACLFGMLMIFPVRAKLIFDLYHPGIPMAIDLYNGLYIPNIPNSRCCTKEFCKS